MARSARTVLLEERAGKSEVQPAESTQITRRRAISTGRVSITTDWYTKLLNIWKKCHLQQCGAVLAGAAHVNICSDDRNFLFIAARPLHTKIYHSKQTIVKSGMEVGFVIKKQDDPNDDIGPALTEILTEIIRNMPGHQRVRVKGFSVSTVSSQYRRWPSG